MLRVTAIGTGTAAPSPNRVCAAHLVEWGESALLLDCGSGAVFRMSNVGADWMRISHVLISHFHPDHISDVPSLLYAWRYGAIPWRQHEATIIGPPGTDALFANLDAVYGGKLRELGFPLNITELHPDTELELAGGLSVSSHRVPHTEESVAYSIRAGRRRVVYTGDTGFDRSLGEWAAGCDLLLAECSLPSEMAIVTHLTPEECAELAAITVPGALALTHFYPPVESVDIARIVRSRYDGPVHLAYDGWTIQFED